MWILEIKKGITKFLKRENSMNTIIKHRAIYVFTMGDKGKTGSF